MYKIILLCAGLLITGQVALAQLEERNKPVTPNGPHVTVDLDSLANDKSTLPAPNPKISFNKIPFDLARSGEKNNLFLKNAGWPDWEKDSLSFYSDYDETPQTPTDTLPVVQIPVADYSAVYVLVSCENDLQYGNVLGLRIGIKNKARQTTYHDYEFEIPRANQKAGVNVIKALPIPGGNAFLMRLPLHAAFSQEFSNHRTLDVEITKKIRLAISKPDAARFQYRPLGLPSGVHLYGMTFERSPIRLSMEATQVGNVFSEPEVPTFSMQIEKVDYDPLKALTVRAKAVDYDGNVIEFPARELPVKAGLTFLPTYSPRFTFPVPRRGYYALTVTVEDSGKILLEKKTTFAVLPSDTRKHRATSPFGTWDFGGVHYTPNEADTVGPLYVKAGLRYGMFGFTAEERARYGIIKGSDPAFHSNITMEKLDQQIAKLKEAGETPERWLLFHEDSVSGDHVTRTPDLFTGKKYKMNEAEQKKFDEMVETIRQSVPKIRAAFPNIQFSLSNGGPQLMEEFLRNKLPADLFDVLGNEAGAFNRLPESQPLDFVANNSSLWMERQLLDQYGYRDKPLEQCYEITYPASNPGNMTLRGQANYVVRNIMHSLSWKVPLIRFEGIADPGNSYYFSNWGGTGLMFGRPNLSPKPLFVATATMTQMLDGATFSRIIPTGTTTVYAFEFKKPNGGFVTCLWTPNAPRPVQLQAGKSQLTVTDLMFNQKVLSASVSLMAKADPVFVESAAPLNVQAGVAIGEELPREKFFTISQLDDTTQWQLIEGKDEELDAYNFMQPRQPGRFAVQTVKEFEGKKNPLEVKALNADTKNWWMPEYSRLQMKQPVAIEGHPTHIGLMVNGNGGWGRIVFELEDAAGQRWISLGTEQEGKPNPWLADWLTPEEFQKLNDSKSNSAGVSDWNSNDAWGRSMINFAGWRYMQFPLPGNYPGEGYHWPYTSQWRCLKADGTRGDYKVHYPLKFTKLAVTARSNVLYGTEVVSVRRPEIYLKDLQVTYGDPDTAFWRPDAGQR